MKKERVEQYNLWPISAFWGLFIFVLTLSFSLPSIFLRQSIGNKANFIHLCMQRKPSGTNLPARICRRLSARQNDRVQADRIHLLRPSEHFQKILGVLRIGQV